MSRALAVLSLEFVLTLAAAAVLLYALIRMSPNYAGGSGVLRGLEEWVAGVSAKESVSGVSVLLVVAIAATKSLLLTLGALLFTCAVSIPLGIVAGFGWHLRWVRGVVHGYYVLCNIPLFILGIAAVDVASRFGTSLNFINWIDMSVSERLATVLVPTALLGIGNGCGADVVRHMRAEMEQIRRQRFILASIANGFSVRWNYVRHAVIPTLGLMDRKMAFLLGGGVVIEYQFGLRGLGFGIHEALQERVSSLDQFSRLGLICLVYAFVVKMVDVVVRTLSMNTDCRLIDPGAPR
jgi:peptide/nickel transport system permease protein